MKYLYEQDDLNPVTLEKELGLTRGDIVEIITYPDGAVEVETKDVLPVAIQDKVRAALVRRGLPRGKAPK